MNFVLSFIPKRVLKFIYARISGVRGAIGLGLRYVVIKRLAKSCGENVFISNNVTLLHIDRMIIGSNVSIHTNCYIDAFGGIEIGSDVSIAHNSTILSANHTWDDIHTPIKYNNVRSARVMISNDVWIGCGCRVLAGVLIKSRTVVAAGAVVNKSLPGNNIIGGLPARVLKII